MAKLILLCTDAYLGLRNSDSFNSPAASSQEGKRKEEKTFWS